MEKKAYPLGNKGMLRDTSISKRDNEHAYENFNIRITANDKETLLSVTNERGHVISSHIAITNGYYLGHCVIENYVVLFVTDDKGEDRIIRCEFNSDGTFKHRDVLFSGTLNFDKDHPIETLGQVETNQVKKVYWVDGKNLTRVINICNLNQGPQSERDPEYGKPYSGFDFIPTVKRVSDSQGNEHNINCTITKSYDGSGYMKPGTIQYFLTLYHKMGTETAVVWSSPLQYSSFEDRGASPEETTTSKFTFDFTFLDGSFDYARLYAYGRSSENTSAFAYIIDDYKLVQDENGYYTAHFVDNGADNTDIDPNQILFLGGQEFIASTLTDKNGKLFLGNLKYPEAEGAEEIGNAIKENCFDFGNDTSFVEGKTYKAKYKDGYGVWFLPFDRSHKDSDNIAYPYTIDLDNGTNGATNIKGFKRGNKYRFGVQFVKNNGSLSRTFWIGDAIAETTAPIDYNKNLMVAMCHLPDEVVGKAKEFGYTQYRLMYVKPSASDRLVASQGVINPTVFNIDERNKRRAFSQTSWITRPINGPIEYSHMNPIKSASGRYGEIQNLQYSDDNKPSALTSFDKIDIIQYAWVVKIFVNLEFWRKNKIEVVLEIGTVDSDGDFISENNFSTDIVKVDNLNMEKTVRKKKDEIITSWNKAFDIYPYFRDAVDLEDVYTSVAAILKAMGSKLFSTKNTTYYVTNTDDLDVTSTYGGEPWTLTKEQFLHGDLPAVVQDGDPTPNAWIRRKFEAEYNKRFKDNIHYSYFTSGVNSLYLNYIKSIKNTYFVDESIVTFDSPDSKEQTFSSDAYKFRLIGISKAINNTFSSLVHTKTNTYSLFGGQRSINTYTQYTNTSGIIVNAGLWYGATHSNYNYDKPRGSADPYSKVPYYIYMWHTCNSIENYGDVDVYNNDPDTTKQKNEESTINYSEIDHKIFCNRYYGDDTRYFKKYVKANINDIKNTFGNAACYINYANSNVMVINKVDQVLSNISRKVQISDDEERDVSFYDIYTGNEGVEWIYNKTGGMSQKTSLMRYSGGSNVVISLKEQLPRIKMETENILNQIALANDVNIFLLHSNSSNSPILPVSVNSIEITKELYDFLQPVGIEKKLLNITIGVIVRDLSLEKNQYWIIQKAADSKDESAVEILNPERYFNFLVKEESRMNIDIEEQEVDDDGNPITDFYYYIQFEDRDTYHDENLIGELSVDDEIYSLVDGRTYKYVEEGSNLLATHLKPVNAGDDVQYKDGMYVVNPIDEDIDGFDYTTDPYLYIGEVYRDENVDVDFGGISQSALNNNIYYPCSMYDQFDAYVGSTDGDTYYQRYDCLRVMPYSDSDVNQVVDICSVMLETYTNLDGRYDTKRYTSDLLTIDWKNFAPINTAYSSDNNVITGSVLDDRYQNGDYSSSIVHSLVKEPNSLVDTWSNITMAGVVGLDSDKGPVNKLTKYANNIYAFQDKAIEQILYDERTQITPSIGVPVEIANSATVSHHMITDMYGSKHKRSIVTAKSGLYFYDYNNGVICSFGEGVQPISTTKGFDTWVREHSDFEGFYDKRHGDIYFLTTSAGSTDYDTLCYNEYLGEFTSFYQYNKPNFMFNLYDHWMSYKDRKYWINNEGEYGNIYDNQQDSLIEYKITPDPYGDKLFTNINYRTDFFDGDTYQEKKTFSHIRAYNEYQDTGDIEIVPVLGASYMPYKKGEVKSFKKFRIWNMDIPRVESSKMDRIRNPWVQIVLQTDYTPLRYEFHNANVIYYE